MLATELGEQPPIHKEATLPLTQEEKERIVEYAGYPVQSVQQGTLQFDESLDRWYFKNLSESAEERVRKYIERIASIETQKEEALKRLQASQVGSDLALNHREFADLEGLKSQYAWELKKFLG